MKWSDNETESESEWDKVRVRLRGSASENRSESESESEREMIMGFRERWTERVRWSDWGTDERGIVTIPKIF